MEDIGYRLRKYSWNITFCIAVVLAIQWGGLLVNPYFHLCAAAWTAGFLFSFLSGGLKHEWGL